MFALTFLALWLTLRLCPDTPVGEMLRRTLVELPAAWLARLTRGQLLIGITAFAATAFIMWLIGSEAARLMSVAVPDTFVWLTTFEVTSYADALAAIAITASSVRWRELMKRLQRRPQRRREVARAVRSRRAPRRLADKADNDNDNDYSRQIALLA